MLLVLYIAIFAALIYFVGVRPQRRAQRERQALQSRLAVGQDVVTASGIYGTVTELEEDDGGEATLLLEIAEDTEIRLARAAVVRILSGDPLTSGEASDLTAAEE